MGIAANPLRLLIIIVLRSKRLRLLLHFLDAPALPFLVLLVLKHANCNRSSYTILFLHKNAADSATAAYFIQQKGAAH